MAYFLDLVGIKIDFVVAIFSDCDRYAPIQQVSDLGHQLVSKIHIDCDHDLDFFCVVGR